jgi:hypothetical protein
VSLWRLSDLPGIPGPKIVKRLFFYPLVTGFQGDDREATGRSGRSGRPKHNHVFSRKVRDISEKSLCHVEDPDSDKWQPVHLVAPSGIQYYPLPPMAPMILCDEVQNT